MTALEWYCDALTVILVTGYLDADMRDWRRTSRYLQITYYDIDFEDLNITPKRRILDETVSIHQYILFLSPQASSANTGKIVRAVHRVG